MVAHVNGFTSRVAAGARQATSPPPTQPAALVPALRGRGLSAEGARQLVAGEPVTAPSDRRALVGLVANALPAVQTPGGNALPAVQLPALQLPAVQLPAVQRPGAGALPAVQTPSAALTHAQLAALQRLGMSGPGAQQLGAGAPVTDARDRGVLAALLAAAFGAGNAAAGDGSVSR